MTFFLCYFWLDNLQVIFFSRFTWTRRLRWLYRLLRNANLFTYCFSAHVHLQSGSAGTFVQYIHIYVTLTIMRIINIGVVLSFCFVNFHCWIMFNDKLSIFFSFFLCISRYLFLQRVAYDTFLQFRFSSSRFARK